MFAAGMGQATLVLEKPGRPAMAGTTPFTIGADAVCADGTCAKLTGVVFDPVAQAVTHLVVERRSFERLVPLGLADATQGGIRIRGTFAEFDKLPAAERTEYLPGSPGDTGCPPSQVLTVPHYGLGRTA